VATLKNMKQILHQFLNLFLDNRRLSITPQLFKKFPHELKDIWFAWNGIYSKQPEKWKYLVPYWDTDGKYIDYKVGDIVPMLKDGDVVAYYKIVNIHKKSWVSDLASWDDGRDYDLVFIKAS
jgi:hypothetical protein